MGKTGVFLREVILKHESDDCLIWPFAIGSNGYGFIAHDGRVQTVHRLVCRLVHGDPPTVKLDAAHSCGDKRCCNHRHLRWATRSQNNKDKLLHGTHDRGERHVGSKYTEQQVTKLLELAKTRSLRQAALATGINYRIAWKIKNGQSWPHIARVA